MNEDMREFARDIRRVSDWLFVAGLIWLGGIGLFVVAMMLHWI